MPKRTRTLRQRPLKGGRVYPFVALDPSIMEWAEREAARSGCYVSFVVNNALSDYTGIEIFETLREAKHRG